MQFLVVVERGPKSFGAYVPDLPGCVAAADTRDEVLEGVQGAIKDYLEGLKEQNRPIPLPMAFSAMVLVK